MSEEPESKRRRLETAPKNSPTSAETTLHASSISSLPDAVLEYCFSFIGNGHYRYVAGTSLHFLEIYSNKRQSKTTFRSAVESVSRAKLYFEEVVEQTGEAGDDILEAISKKAIVTGTVEVLEWIRTKGVEFSNKHFRVAAYLAHTSVFKWAEEKNLEWYGEDTFIALSARGHIAILAWIRDLGREIPEVTADTAALSGQASVLNWLKEQDLLDAASAPMFWRSASKGGHTNVMDWLHDNGYAVCRESIYQGAALEGGDYVKSLIWAREHGITLDELTSGYAALNGNLPMLQWLRESDCPWDARVIYLSIYFGHDHVVEYAIANGCPTEF
jgi:hypothetical protein